MTTTYRMTDTNMEESPATMAYVLLVMASAYFDFDIHLDDDLLSFVDDRTGEPLMSLEIDPAFGPLMMSVLMRTNEELAACPSFQS